MKRARPLENLLLAGSLYFLAVSFVHLFGIKVPVLFIYFDVPSNVYQDRIISVLSFVFSVFLFAGARLSRVTLNIVKYILIAGLGAILGLMYNNFFTSLEHRGNLIYWLEIGGLTIYLTGLWFLYKRAKLSKIE